MRGGVGGGEEGLSGYLFIHIHIYIIHSSKITIHVLTRTYIHSMHKLQYSSSSIAQPTMEEGEEEEKEEEEEEEKEEIGIRIYDLMEGGACLVDWDSVKAEE
jgi:hypothetical protein